MNMIACGIAVAPAILLFQPSLGLCCENSDYQELMGGFISAIYEDVGDWDSGARWQLTERFLIENNNKISGLNIEEYSKIIWIGLSYGSLSEGVLNFLLEMKSEEEVQETIGMLRQRISDNPKFTEAISDERIDSIETLFAALSSGETVPSVNDEIIRSATVFREECEEVGSEGSKIPGSGDNINLQPDEESAPTSDPQGSP